MVRIYRRDGTTLRPIEYLLNNSGDPMEFGNVEDAKNFLRELGFTDSEIKGFVFETVDIYPVEVKAVLDRVAEYIVKKCAAATISGSYLIHADDLPGALLSPELFSKYSSAIADIMMSYESVVDADVDDDAISVIMYLDYYPNCEPTHTETLDGTFPDNIVPLDPLSKRQFMDAYTTIGQIEDLFIVSEILIEKLPTSIKKAILAHHNEPATIQHCIRWGLQATKEIRSDWHTVVADIPSDE